VIQNFMIESDSGIDVEQLAHAVAGVLRDEDVTVVNAETDEEAKDYRAEHEDNDE
jgi:hypothetical protein